MGIAATLENYLCTKAIAFDVHQHNYAEGSFNTANAAQIPAGNLAKAVVFRDEDFYYTMAVIPSGNKVRRHTLNQIFDRSLKLAEEDELEALFSDCAPGAIPALGQAYGVNVIWDDQLLEVEDIWMKSGDHRLLVHISRQQFELLMLDHMHQQFSANATREPTKRR